MLRLPVCLTLSGLATLLPVCVLTALSASAADLIQPVAQKSAEREIDDALRKPRR